MKESISSQVKDYIETHHEIKQCIHLVNFSSLARKIIKETKLKNFNAILVAANRYADTVKQSKERKEILSLLKKSKLNVKTPVARFVFSSKAQIHDDIEPIHIIKGVSTTTVIVEQDHYDMISERYEHYILDKEKDLIELAVISPKDADEVLGFTSFLSSLISSRGVNILTVLGSYTDDVFIIKKMDLGKAMLALEGVLK